MRHRNHNKRFKRTSSHRKSLFNNLSKMLIKYELIKTTVQKAKELRRHIEPLITISKNDNFNNRKNVFKKIKDKNLVKKLFDIIGKRYLNRNGGYTKIIKYKYRIGDAATLAIIKLIN